MKTCSRCGERKPLSAFRVRSGRSGINSLHSYCRPCEKKYWKEGPNRRWVNLSANIRRHNGQAPTPKQLRENLGDPHTCYLCGDSVSWDDSELDHVLPLSAGGATIVGNLAWTHRSCNRMKHDLTVDAFVLQLHKILAHLN